VFYREDWFKRMKGFAILLSLLLPALAGAQQIATKDLRQPSRSSSQSTQGLEKPQNPTGCEKVGVGFADGVSEPETPRQIKLALVKISSPKLILGAEITATVKLQNAGSSPIRIPWNTDFDPTLKDQNPESRSWEFGEFRFAIRNEANRYVDLLNTSLPLYGSEFVPGSLLTITPGQWITAQVSFRIALAPDALGMIDEGPAELTVEWFQTGRTRVVEGCGVTQGFYPHDGFYKDANRVVVRRVRILRPDTMMKSGSHSPLP